MSTIVMPDTSFLLSEDQLLAQRARSDELEAFREQTRQENLNKAERIVGRIKPVHEVDPKTSLMDKYSEIIKDVPIYGASVLVAIYRRPEKTKGGIIVTSGNLDEDLYQGKVGLVIKIGPYPPDEDDLKYFNGKPPQIGDWVVFKASNGTSFGLLDRKGDCRFLKERRDIWMTIPDPDMVW